MIATRSNWPELGNKFGEILRKYKNEKWYIPFITSALNEFIFNSVTKSIITILYNEIVKI